MWNSRLTLLFPITIFITFIIASFPVQGQEITVLVNNTPVHFTGVKPLDSGTNGRILVPAKEIFECLGARMRWISKTKTLRVGEGSRLLVMHAGNRQGVFAGKSVTFDPPPVLYSNRMMVPLSAVSMYSGVEARWEMETRTVRIDTVQGVRQPRTTKTPSLSIQSITHNGRGILKEGDSLVVRLVGTPDSAATFSVGSLATNIPMQEDPLENGTYRGIFRVPRGTTLMNAPIFARLARGDLSTPVAQAPGLINIDTAAPRLVDIHPVPDSRVINSIPNLFIVLDDQGGTGIDTSSVRLFINGRDVTRQAAISRRHVAYIPPLPLQRANRIRLTAGDMAGNTATSDWTLMAIRDINGIRAIFHNATSPLQPGSSVTVTMTGVPGSRASFTVDGIDKSVPMSETAIGEYVGHFAIPGNWNKAGLYRITGKLVLHDGRTLSKETTAPIYIVPQTVPAPPAIDTPKPNERAGSNLIVSGHTVPGYSILVKIIHQNNQQGIYRLDCVSASQSVIPESNGNFRTKPLPIIMMPGTGIRYVISATAVDLLGRESDPTIVPIRRKP